MSTIHWPSHANAGKARIESWRRKEYIISNDRKGGNGTVLELGSSSNGSSGERQTRPR